MNDSSIAADHQDDYSTFLTDKLASVPSAGFEPTSIAEHLFPFQRDIVRWALRRGKAAIFADTGLGKQQPVSEPVLTPRGWSTMGELKVGDYVMGANGRPTRVCGVFPQGIRRVYRLELSDGTFVRAGSEHLWNVRTKVQRYRGEGFTTKTTEEIAGEIHRDWQLPMVNPVEFSFPTNLPIDPYALGVILGDGSLSGGIRVTTDHWIGKHLGWRKVADHKTCSYVGDYQPPREIVDQLNGFGLRGSVSDTKFVPSPYLVASPDARLELLRGLMDTDGYPMPDGGAEFCSTSQRLIQFVCEAVRSLGGVARGLRRAKAAYMYKGKKRIGKPAWRVNVKLPAGVEPFRLPRKAERYTSPTKYPPARIIRRIVDEQVSEPQVCIKVEAPDGLYVSRDYIVTHNTPMQLEWARQVAAHTGKPVLILAPLAVAKQTARAATAFGLAVVYAQQASAINSHSDHPDDWHTQPNIIATNYERLEHFPAHHFGGIVLDESSILKSFDGKTRDRIIEAFKETPYRLACTATPAPNDTTELGNHSEFLGVMTRAEMLAMYFFHDGGDTSKWTLKGHARESFWKWVASWGCVVRRPSDVHPDYDDERFKLPPIEYHTHIVAADADAAKNQGRLWAEPASSLTEQRKVRRETLEDRCKLAAGLVPDAGPCLVWCELNDESELLSTLIPGSEEISGTDKQEEKERKLFGFCDGAPRVAISKPKLAGFGLNWQHCAHVVFVGVTHSFESYYQAVRRCYRFGQSRAVRVDIVSSELEGKVLENLQRKEAEAAEMQEEMVTLTREQMRIELGTMPAPKDRSYAESTQSGKDWTMHNGDCCEVIQRLPDESIDYTIFSPPFASLYTYSDSERDMGNCVDHDEFYKHFSFLVPQLLRVTKPGRLLSFHCMNLPTSKSRDGYIGLTDFRGILIRAFIDAGWIYHSEVTIWKDPVTAMQRTHALGLLYKQLRKDSCMSRMGIPDYLVTMRKPGVNAKPVEHKPEEFTVDQWQKWASPVWMDINPNDTLQGRSAREHEDERHICPLQLDVIHRSLILYSNPGEVVLSPFGGIGSEGYVALREGRQFIGIELKKSYFEQACRNLEAISVGTKAQLGLFPSG